jgi:hypothetical protein
MATIAYACADCGHDMDTHYWERCSKCDEDINFCECSEDDLDIYDGCEQCDCEGFRKPKTDQSDSPAADPDQLRLFGTADA